MDKKYYEHDLCVENPEEFNMTQAPNFFALRKQSYTFGTIL